MPSEIEALRGEIHSLEDRIKSYSLGLLQDLDAQVSQTEGFWSPKSEDELRAEYEKTEALKRKIAEFNETTTELAQKRGLLKKLEAEEGGVDQSS